MDYSGEKKEKVKGNYKGERDINNGKNKVGIKLHDMRGPQTKTPIQKSNVWKPKPHDGNGLHEKQLNPTVVPDETKTP